MFQGKDIGAVLYQSFTMRMDRIEFLINLNYLSFFPMILIWKIKEMPYLIKIVGGTLYAQKLIKKLIERLTP